MSLPKYNIVCRDVNVHDYYRENIKLYIVNIYIDKWPLILGHFEESFVDCIHQCILYLSVAVERMGNDHYA